MHSLEVRTILASACLGAGLLAGCAPAAATAPAASRVPPSATPAPTATPEPTATITVSPTPACVAQSGTLEQSNYTSDQVGREVPLWVYTPPCYGSQQEMLPAAYFFHGKPYDQSHWPGLDVIERYEAGLEEDRWPRALLVFPNLAEPLFSRSDGGPGSYEQEFIEGAMAAVEGRYAVDTRAAARSVAGISRGGIWSLEIGFNNAELFQRVAALSPSLSVNYPRPAYDPFQLALAPTHQPERVLLLAGQDDWARPQTERLAEVLADAGAQVELEIVPGAHQDATWQQALPQVLDFLLSE